MGPSHHIIRNLFLEVAIFKKIGSNNGCWIGIGFLIYQICSGIIKIKRFIYHGNINIGLKASKYVQSGINVCGYIYMCVCVCVYTII
jgi:hypothetical protein